MSVSHPSHFMHTARSGLKCTAAFRSLHLPLTTLPGGGLGAHHHHGEKGSWRQGNECYWWARHLNPRCSMKSSHSSTIFFKITVLYIVNNWNKWWATFSFNCNYFLFYDQKFPSASAAPMCPTLGLWSPPFKQTVFWGGRSLMGIGLDQQNINTSWPLLTTFPSCICSSNSLSLLLHLHICPFPLLKPFASVYACPFFFFTLMLYLLSPTMTPVCQLQLPPSLCRVPQRLCWSSTNCCTKTLKVWDFLGRTVTWEIKHT